MLSWLVSTKRGTIMSRFIVIVFALCLFIGCDTNSTSYSGGSSYSSGGSSDIDKIIAAKEIVRGMVNYPDTLNFHDYSYSPKISGNTVTLKFTAENAFGVPETHVMDIRVR